MQHRFRRRVSLHRRRRFVSIPVRKVNSVINCTIHGKFRYVGDCVAVKFKSHNHNSLIVLCRQFIHGLRRLHRAEMIATKKGTKGPKENTNQCKALPQKKVISKLRNFECPLLCFLCIFAASLFYLRNLPTISLRIEWIIRIKKQGSSRRLELRFDRRYSFDKLHWKISKLI